MANQCMWLKRGNKKFAKKPCRGEYCGQHRQQILFYSRTPLSPCRHCGAGTKAAAQLCMPCGGHRTARKLRAIEKRARKKFTRVMIELLNRSQT